MPQDCSINLDITRELQRTRPDYVVYVPRSLDGSTFDTGNEHFLVFDGPDGSLMAVWTQSTAEGLPNQRIVFSQSSDEGHTWTSPQLIAGPKPPAVGGLASWAFPMVSLTGRIYVIFSQHIGVNDFSTHTTGLMHGIYSDDAGASWSAPQNIPMRRSPYDHPDPSIPSNWIVWQKPLRLSDGKYFNGMTRWISPQVCHKGPGKSWIEAESVVEFLRWENLDDNPEPKNLIIGNFAFGPDAIRVSYPGCPELSVVQEPSIVKLPNGDLFSVMRTAAGHPYYVFSADEGEYWSAPAPLRYTDTGPALRHPLSPCPLYDLGDGRYFLLFHNHDGHFEQWTPYDTSYHRRPIYACLGEYRPGARQPLWFSQPKFMMDDDGVALGANGGRCDLAMYASLTRRQNRVVLWYPDRKYFLLGRNLDKLFLNGLHVESSSCPTIPGSVP